MVYTQHEKNRAREKLLSHAVAILTNKRNESSCVRASYVRDLKRWFLSEGGNQDAHEAQKIDDSYICAWENLRYSSIGIKRPEDLKVCYLAGPEPMNDFAVLKSLGVKPQNIWAFESSEAEFSEALQQCCGVGFNQPKLIKMKIERFLESVPMSFDIVYLDFCSSFISSRGAMKCVASLFRFHRLCSPGVLITNFAEADQSKKEEYVQLLARYYFIKDNATRLMNQGEDVDYTDRINDASETIKQSFSKYYGDFITDFICSIADVVTPAQRLANSSLYSFFTNIGTGYQIPEERIHISSFPDQILRFLMCGDDRCPHASLKLECSVMQELDKQLRVKSEKSPIEDLICCTALRDCSTPLREEIDEIAEAFANTYRFLDQPRKSLYLDFAMRQLSYPMHSNPMSSLRISYVGKHTRMFADATVFDDCRYIYDWFPAALQGTEPLEDASWLYVFRFALDGLVKCRMGMNSDYFYQGSVVHRDVYSFGMAGLDERSIIN